MDLEKKKGGGGKKCRGLRKGRVSKTPDQRVPVKGERYSNKEGASRKMATKKEVRVPFSRGGGGPPEKKHTTVKKEERERIRAPRREEGNYSSCWTDDVPQQRREDFAIG